jgi:hypothetical protein
VRGVIRDAISSLVDRLCADARVCSKMSRTVRRPD